MSSSAITSETAKRPPGRRTRATSRSSFGLSAERLITQFEITTSTLASTRGIASIWPLVALDVFEACLELVIAGEREHLVGHIETVAPLRSARRAGLRAERRSRHRSRDRGPSRLRVVRQRRSGLPQPREASARCRGAVRGRRARRARRRRPRCRRQRSRSACSTPRPDRSSSPGRRRRRSARAPAPGRRRTGAGPVLAAQPQPSPWLGSQQSAFALGSQQRPAASGAQQELVVVSTGASVQPCG